MITVIETRSESFSNNDYRKRTIIIKFLGLVIYKKNIERVV